MLKQKQNYSTFTVSCEKFKMVSVASSIMKNIIVSKFMISPSAFRALSRSSVKLIYCIAFRSASSVCCLLKSITIIL